MRQFTGSGNEKQWNSQTVHDNLIPYFDFSMAKLAS